MAKQRGKNSSTTGKTTPAEEKKTPPVVPESKDKAPEETPATENTGAEGIGAGESGELNTGSENTGESGADPKTNVDGAESTDTGEASTANKDAADDTDTAVAGGVVEGAAAGGSDVSNVTGDNIIETPANVDEVNSDSVATPDTEVAGDDGLEDIVEDEVVKEDPTHGGRYDLIDTTDLSTELATLAGVINGYLKAMAGNQIIHGDVIVNQQKLLIGIINTILSIEDGPKFKAAMDMFRDVVKTHRSRQFHESRVYRGYNQLGVSANFSRRAQYFISTMMAHVDTGDQATTSRTDVSHLTGLIKNDKTKQLVNSYFGAQ